jgi:hypothetical protein
MKNSPSHRLAGLCPRRYAQRPGATECGWICARSILIASHACHVFCRLCCCRCSRCQGPLDFCEKKSSLFCSFFFIDQQPVNKPLVYSTTGVHQTQGANLAADILAGDDDDNFSPFS